jgi:hypothetical protein
VRVRCEVIGLVRDKLDDSYDCDDGLQELWYC